MALEEEKGKYYKDISIYKEKVSWHKDTIVSVEKEKVKLLVFKAASSQQVTGSTSKSLSKSISKLKIREDEIQTLKHDIDEKEDKIVSLNKVVANKYSLIFKLEEYRKEVKAKWSKANTKFIVKNSFVWIQTYIMGLVIG